ncbi:MAG: hypothetical protein F6K41_38280 [Symploca sp. SIO3E6]|nr:hypothetical protein [Caldora sp. SIO3E6]
MLLSREQRSRGAEEQREKNTIFLNPWVFPYIESFLAPKYHIWELTKCTTLVSLSPHTSHTSHTSHTPHTPYLG